MEQNLVANKEISYVVGLFDNHRFLLSEYGSVSIAPTYL